jgi:hypothetical protein
MEEEEKGDAGDSKPPPTNLRKRLTRGAKDGKKSE